MANPKSLDGITTDIEKQEEALHAGESCVKDGRTAGLQALFGFPTETLEKVPTALAWCFYLEDCFQPLTSDDYVIVWNALGLPRPRTTHDCWALFEIVASTIVSVCDSGTSIEEIWDGVLTSRQVAGPTKPPRSFEKFACFVTVFSILCWGSMTLRPKLVWTTPRTSPCLAVENLQNQHQDLKMDLAQRPITAVFRNIQQSKLNKLWRRPINAATTTGTSTVLYVSTLNFSSLRTIGKIRLKWVDAISSHLDFDSRTRTLSIFRFPSFCALTTCGESRGIIFEESTRALYCPTDDDSVREFASNVQLSQEILMSYRLLFGQTRSSRKLAKTSLREELGGKTDYDELLRLLCCKPHKQVVKTALPSFWPVSCRDYNNVLSEVDSYSAQDDFPMFSQRLAVLQEFSLRQQPSRLRDLWRDRRNPLQWYTFWAVVIFGGASLIIALLQLAVAIVAIPVTNGSSCTCAIA